MTKISAWVAKCTCRIIATNPLIPIAEEAACYVSNYPNENAAAQHQGLIATVAMNYVGLGRPTRCASMCTSRTEIGWRTRFWTAEVQSRSRGCA